MKLYHVQDADRPMYVIAVSYADALQKWRGKIAAENDCTVAEVEDPEGLQFMCDDEELII